MKRALAVIVAALFLVSCTSTPATRPGATTAPASVTAPATVAPATVSATPSLAATATGYQFPPGVTGDQACLREGGWIAYAQNELEPPDRGAFLYNHPYGPKYGATRVGSILGNDRVAIIGHMVVPQQYWKALDNDPNFKGEIAYYVYNLTRPGNVGWVGNYGLRNTTTSPVDDPVAYRFDPVQAVGIHDDMCRLSFR